MYEPELSCTKFASVASCSSEKDLEAEAEASSTSNPIFLNLEDTDLVEVSSSSAASATTACDTGLWSPMKSTSCCVLSSVHFGNAILIFLY